MRKNPKFCPTPTKPIDNHSHYQDFILYREAVRWAYDFAKKNDFKPEPNTFVKPPWYQRTTRAAPLASPAVEAFLESCLRDLMDPANRRRIKDNLDDGAVSYTHLRAHETPEHLVCRVLL